MKLWQKGKMWPFSKQIFARHMIMWIIMHFFIFSKVWMPPPQAIYVVEKVLWESITWLSNIGRSKRGGTKESIQSWTGVRQGCPISSLLFVIVFDILLVSLKKKYNPQDLSGFLDDLGMVLQKAETINSLTPTFKKYEEATGAKLNFNKCFVLSIESYKPVGPWAEMVRFNYYGDRTVYLGVKLSKQLSPLKDWEKVILKMKKVGAAIKKRGGNFCLRVRMVNTYLTPCIGYLARFKLILKSVTSIQRWAQAALAIVVFFGVEVTSNIPFESSKEKIWHHIHVFTLVVSLLICLFFGWMRMVKVEEMEQKRKEKRKKKCVFCYSFDDWIV